MSITKGSKSVAVTAGLPLTFLSPLSLPYTHYSLLARCQVVQRRFFEHYFWGEATVAAQ
jgi:hypothetical protein